MTHKRFSLWTMTGALLVILLLTPLLTSVYAQDATATPDSAGEATEEADMTTDAEATEDADTTTDTDTSVDDTTSCDSDLILVLYVAERFFDFDTFVGEMSMDTTVNIDNIDKGQYEPLFADLSNTAGADTFQISDEARNNISNMMAMSDTEFEGTMTSTMMSDTTVTLAPLTISGESDECAELRRLLHRFFSSIALNESNITATSGMDTTDTTTTGDDATETASTNVEGAITVNLSGANEVPGPGDDDGSGTATVYLRTDSAEVCVDLSVQNITLPASAAHIHQGTADEAGPPIITLNAPGEDGFSSTCMVVDETLMQDLVNNPGNYYVNIHTDEFPDGAVRGQLN